jgi:hypothetical protein
MVIGAGKPAQMKEQICQDHGGPMIICRKQTFESLKALKRFTGRIVAPAPGTSNLSIYGPPCPFYPARTAANRRKPSFSKPPLKFRKMPEKPVLFGRHFASGIEDFRNTIAIFPSPICNLYKW